MCSQGIPQFYLQTHKFIRNRNEPYLHLPSQPQLVLIYRPRRDGRLTRPWCEVAQAEIRTCNLPIANMALYHPATSAPVGSNTYQEGKVLRCAGVEVADGVVRPVPLPGAEGSFQSEDGTSASVPCRSRRQQLLVEDQLETSPRQMTTGRKQDRLLRGWRSRPVAAAVLHNTHEHTWTIRTVDRTHS